MQNIGVGKEFWLRIFFNLLSGDWDFMSFEQEIERTEEGDCGISLEEVK